MKIDCNKLDGVEKNKILSHIMLADETVARLVAETLTKENREVGVKVLFNGVEFGKQVHLGYYYTLKEALRVAKKQREIYVDKLKSLYGDTVESKVFEVLLEDRGSE